MALFTHIPVWKPQYLRRYASELGNVRPSPRRLMVCDPFAILLPMFITTISLHSIIQAKNVRMHLTE